MINKTKFFTPVTAIIFLSFCLFTFGILIQQFRFAVDDETIYLREAMTMAEVLKNGEWIGNYAVGLHGFLFKLPVALIFIITGPSVFIATLFNIILAIVSAFILFYICFKHLKLGWWAVAVTLLYITNYYFIIVLPTFLREIPVILSLFLLIEGVLSRRNSWILGLWILLVFDAKEHVFFMIVPALSLWTALKAYQENNSKFNIHMLIKYARDMVRLFLPSFAYFMLMISTGLIPVNMFTMSITGLIDKGLSWNTGHFKVDVSTDNLLSGEGKTIKTIQTGAVVLPWFLQKPLDVLNTLILYIGKIMYPRTFSFLSIPLVLLVPALSASFVKFKEWFWEKKYHLYIIPLCIWSYLAVYILRASHARYLLPIVPFILIFLIYFIIEKQFHIKYRYTFITLFITSLLATGSIFFESSYVLVKSVLNVFLLFIIISIAYFKDDLKNNHLYIMYPFAIFIIAFFNVGSVMFFNITKGQIYKSINYGINNDIGFIAQNVNKDDIVWINDPSIKNMLAFHRRDITMDPEWKWQINMYVPKEQMLEKLDPKTHVYYYKNLKNFREKLKNTEVDSILLIQYHTDDNKKLANRKYEELKDVYWLNQESSYTLTNKTLYIYSPNELL